MRSTDERPPAAQLRRGAVALWALVTVAFQATLAHWSGTGDQIRFHVEDYPAYFLFWTAPLVLAGIALRRHAIVLSTAAIAAVALLGELLGGHADPDRPWKWLVQLATSGAFVAIGAWIRARWRPGVPRRAATASLETIPALGALGVLAAIAAPPAIVATVWLQRDAPPGLGCLEAPPPGHEALVETFRTGAAPATATALCGVLAVALALSAYRRGRTRPGAASLIVATAVTGYAAAAVVHRPLFDALAGVAWLLVLALPVTLTALGVSLAWVVSTPRPQRRTALLSAAAWICALWVLPVIAGAIAAAGTMPDLCL